MKYLWIVFYLFISSTLIGQAVVWTEPVFPNQFDDITLYYDASEGNKALEDYNGDVYAHMGLITSQSSSGTDWKHVVGNWGTPDAETLLTNEGNNIYSKSYNIQDFHNVSGGTEVLKLAFVFRNGDGSIVGRDTDGSDIYYDVYPTTGSIFSQLFSPNWTVINAGDSILYHLVLNQDAEIILTDKGEELYHETGSQFNFYHTPSESGYHDVQITINGLSDTLILDNGYYVINQDGVVMDPPAGLKNGVNYTDTSYIFQFKAPGKSNVFFYCLANEFKIDEDYLMNRSEDGTTFWIELEKDLFLNGGNVYQYFMVDDAIKASDPYSMFILDPWADPGVPADILNTFPPYPVDYTNFEVTTFPLEPSDYEWEVEGFEKPEKTNLVIYELLVRDFLEDRSFVSLTDTLDYFEKLGVNAIELMPIAQFEWNISWGYNVTHHMALDKYYGTADQLRMFIDEAHKRGIAVIQDVVFNHAFGNSPLSYLWWDSSTNKPSIESAYMNPDAKHPFNVGYDMNHESEYTREYVKQVLEYWIEEFKFDGFRFDLSKGFTQFDSGDNAELMAKYDQSRVDILQDYADHVWSLDPDSYVILEHFAENNEDKVLANYGMMPWGNMNYQFNEATMGYAADLSWLDYKERVWLNNHVVGYMESHDEERLMYRNSKYGKIDGDHNTRELRTAMRRQEAASTIFYGLPGPRMLFQFGELGYDYSLFHCGNGPPNESCKLDPKPVRWDWLEEEDRKHLFDVTSAMIHLRTNYPTFQTDDYTFYDGNFYLKTLTLEHEDMDAVIMANFRTVEAALNPKFSKEGTWYEYFTGDSLVVNDTQEKINFYPGEYRVYLSKPLTPPGGTITKTEALEINALTVYPNPLDGNQELQILLPNAAPIDQIKLVDMQGRAYGLSSDQDLDILRVHLPQDLIDGMYVIQIWSDGKLFIAKLIKKQRSASNTLFS